MQPHAKKKLGVRQLTILTAVNMAGSGIILLPANLAQVGTISVLSWLVTTAGATCLAYAFARAGTFSRLTGGMGAYAEYAHGKSGNFLTNYTYFISLLIANVAIALALVGYAAGFFNTTLGAWPTAFWTVGVLWLATVLNFWGPRRTGHITSFTVLGVLLPIVFLSLFGWFWFHPHMYVHAWNPHGYTIWHGLSASIAVTLWAFLGLESACANTHAVENPKRDVPIAVMFATLICAFFYIVSTSIVQGMIPGSVLANSTAPFGLAFAHMFNHTVGKVVIGMMVISCFGSLFAWQFTIAEVARSCALVGYFPRLFKKITKAEAPIIGLVIITVAQMVMSFMTVNPSLDKQWTTLVNFSVMTNLIPYLLCMAALIVLQRVEHVPAKMARSANIAAVLATIYSLYALHATGTTAMMWGGIVTFAGWMLYGVVAPRFTKTVPAPEAPLEGLPSLEYVTEAETVPAVELATSSTTGAEPPLVVLTPADQLAATGLNPTERR
jgi:putrescine:ornithine antiporter